MEAGDKKKREKMRGENGKDGEEFAGKKRIKKRR